MDVGPETDRVFVKSLTALAPHTNLSGR
jgi:hypothetical protein